MKKAAEKVVKPSAELVKKYQKILQLIRDESSNIIVGQDEVINGLLRALLCDGHVLLEGIPGIAKTLIIRTLAKVTGCHYSRIQFTADLLPTDLVGLTTYIKEKDEFRVNKGPVFANYVIADEINRSPPKTQSALLEAMQERQVTIGNKTYPLPDPFFVMATQNPIESSGVYPLPEAQIDRFLFKIKIVYPKLHEENEILTKNITLKRFDEVKLSSVTNPREIIAMQEFIKKIYLSKEVENYIIKLVDATRNPNKYKINSGQYIEWGCSPRASIGLYIASKAEALIKGSNYVTPAHVKAVAHDVMRHRILLNYEGQAENIKTDDIVTEVLSKVPIP
ncbi:MAG: MoxR family ATPase [Nanoarchaeota archaeon]